MDVDTEELVQDEELDSDYSDGDEKILEQEVIDLENKISQNRFAYQPYVDLISALKSLVDLDRLRNARERMAKQFPLSSDLWMDWLQDEINVATSLEEKKKILDLFEAAVKDYLSVDIWLQYITFVISNQNEQNLSETGNVRKVFEESLSAAGLHVTKGSILWDTYIEYEKTVLSTLTENPQQYRMQLKLIANLYKRQLSCPLWGMEQTYDKFKKWLENIKDNPEQIIDLKIVENIYKKAKDKFDKIKPFEEALLSGTENQKEIFNSYLEHEKSKEGSPVRVQCLYERILCENCLSEEFWLDYINYVDSVLNSKDVVLNVIKRALRNCPWCCQLYQVHIRCLEKYDQPQQMVTEVVEDAFESGLQTASDFRDIWMSYLEYLRRSFDSPAITREEEEKRLEDLKTAFAKALEYLCQLPDADSECTIAQFWARIEANYSKNMEKSRELWNDIVSEEKNKTAEMWLEYIQLERIFGDSKHLRKLYRRALQNTKDFPEKIAKSWLNYERDEGTFESYEDCVSKIKMRLKQVEEKREKEAEAVHTEKFSNDFQAKLKKKMSLKKKEKSQFDAVRGNEPKRSIGNKRKQDNLFEESSPSKKPKESQRENESEEKIQSSEDLVAKLFEENKNSHGETVVHDSSKDDRTVFVSNLDFATDESIIRDIFSSCGVIKDLRLVKDYKGRSKGYCYVEFEKPRFILQCFEHGGKGPYCISYEGSPVAVSERENNPLAQACLGLGRISPDCPRQSDLDCERSCQVEYPSGVRSISTLTNEQKEAQAALKKDRELILRRPMFVSKCDPDKDTRRTGFKYSSNMEKNKLFIRGLPFTTTAEELRSLFSQYGALKDVRLVTYRNGHSKGLAYVEFEDEGSAAQAILKTDGTIIQGKEISVAISNPPGRKVESSSKLISSLGGGPKIFGPRGKSRTQISLLPRSVQLNKPTTPADSLANLSIASPNSPLLSPEEQKNLNNSDFRRLLN